MKALAYLMLLSGFSAGVEKATDNGSNNEITPPELQTRITGPVADGKPPAPVVVTQIPVFNIKSVQTRRLADRNLTIRLVEPPVPSMRAKSPAPRSPEIKQGEGCAGGITDMEPIETELLFISATVHRDRLSHIHGWTSRGHDFSAWTDIDFNDFSGFSSFIHGNRQYGLVMGIGADDFMPANAVFPPKHGGFRFIKGENPETTVIADAFRSLYAAEWKTLAAARRGREAAARLAAAQLPAPPEDIVLSVWDKPSRPLTAAEKMLRDRKKEQSAR